MMYAHDATFTSGLQWQARPRSPLSASAPGSTQVLVWALAQKGQRRTCVLPAQVPRGCCGSGDFLLVVDSRPWWCGSQASSCRGSSTPWRAVSCCTKGSSSCRGPVLRGSLENQNWSLILCFLNPKTQISKPFITL